MITDEQILENIKEFKEKIPVIFDDLYESFVGGINEKTE